MTDNDTRREAVAREMGYRLRTVAAYYRTCGRYGEAPDPAYIEREIQGGTDHILAALPAPVPDTRREDVARRAKYQAMRDHEPRHMGCACGAKFGDSIDARWHLANQVTDAVLAALPAPPVVDEAEIAKVLAEFDSVPWANMRRETKDIYRSMAAAVGARLRGATR